MTYLPKGEIVGVLSPYTINAKDIGNTWQSTFDTGIGSNIFSIAYISNGIVLVGGATGFLYRSTDYGKNYVSLGQVGGAVSILSIAYLGNGIAIFSTSNTRTWISTDYGLTWLSQGVQAGAAGKIDDVAYFGNGIAVFGEEANNRIFRSTDFGSSWVNTGSVAAGDINKFIYLDNGIAITIDTAGDIFRSTDYGATWSPQGNISGAVLGLSAGVYIGNGIVLVADRAGHIFRSQDYAAALTSWTDEGVKSSGGTSINTMTYLGNGIVIFGDTAGHIWRSTDFGLTWTDLGVFFSLGITKSTYVDNGISLTAGIDVATGKVFRSDVSYKTSESSIAKIASVDTLFFRRFFQNEGTQVAGTWSWVADVNQTNYSSLRGEGAGYWKNTTVPVPAPGDEYSWSNVHLGPGLYEIDIVYVTANNLGIADILFGTTSLGNIDMYSVGTVNNVAAAIQFSVSTATTANIRFFENGKNGASAGFGIVFSRFELFKYG